MDEKERVQKEKLLSLILRHKPERINLMPDKGGWFNVDELLKKLGWTREMLDEIVSNNDKKRYGYDAQGTHIRAHQGHSYPIDLGYEPSVPPEFLYQGTVERFPPPLSKLKGSTR